MNNPLALRILLRQLTEILTRFEAYAAPFEASAGRVQSCVTTGRLEHTIVDRIAARVDMARRSIEIIDPCGDAVSWTSVLPIERGEDVRLKRGAYDYVIGTLSCVVSDTLMVRRGALTRSLPSMGIETFEVRRERESYGRHGAIVGGALGALAGLLTTESGGKHWSTQGRILGPGLGGIFGGLIGAFIGSKIRGDYWEEVLLDQIRTETSGAGVRVEFRLVR